ncbi:ArsR/SmtB family transcription factor [Nocardioides bizhenqiangii]|uniref:Metalloregulator ArsR/SmtB family transcription factor n=1 Tax=Nocardioides bizhenqiangii TaxID=3095076 RepID=A0ABZ0ZMX2_9ACTN|nr:MULTISPECIES: metalloregulator ArsR/SmtB family transcription factor [unclassified Nocardioides]MDZ5620920.1 metalloregulator ArsR/SmtB family transcription factor [Nocardioides sp. HM23]WQQ25281.1 metalloregulator ArsR/SmtB family transcription factor [Nocardioides sp. HM61]
MTIELPLLPDLASCCSPATGGRIDDAAAEALARMFKALADPNRVKLLSMIAAADGQEACVCDLTAPVGLAQPTISHHMKVLADAGLVAREQRGKWAYYSLVPGILESLADALAPGR